MTALLARQPIFDRDQTVRGYELLYRSRDRNAALVLDDELATATVAINALTEFGLERIVGQQRAWINVSREFILEGHVKALPADRVVLELLEDQLVDPALLDALAELRHAGYTIALDDFVLTTATEPLLDIADVVKLDVALLGPDRFRQHATALAPYDALILAEKIETHADLAVALDAGCDLIQGYFFCRPELLSTKQIAPNQLTAIKLASAVQDPDVQLSELAQIISCDLGLSYRLLRYINSAHIGMRHHIDTVPQAIALLGLENVRRWLSITLLARLADKPREILHTALIRARFCQQAGHGQGPTPTELFTLGLFSLLDALTDTPMSTIVQQLPFTPQMRDALTHHTGPGWLLDRIQAIERGHRNHTNAAAEQLHADYLDAIAWTTHETQALLAAA